VRRLAFALLFACCGLPLAAGCGAPPDPPKTSPEAMSEAHDPAILFARGRGYVKSGDLNRAEEYLTAAIDAGADAKQVLPLLLHVCIAAGNYRLALDHAERALQKAPADTRLRFVVASLYQGTGDPTAAKENLDRVTREDPNFADAQFALGVLMRDDLKDHAGAEPHFRAYLKLAPTGAHADEARQSILEPAP
jgi:tetratricopeptide (TPR) repeat protein